MKYELSSSSNILTGTQHSVGQATGFLASLIEAPFIWLERAHDRRRLAELDDHMLRDIGISRADADQVASRPFWQE